MLREGDTSTALEGLKKHLGIQCAADEVSLKKWGNVIPQYSVGHLERVKTFEKYLKENYPQITCIGNYLHGVSLNQCVRLAQTLN